MREIKLPSGHVCQVDDSDYECLTKFKWYRKKIKTNVYAQTWYLLPNGKKKWVNMHRMLLPDVKEIDHKDNNGLNNQRENLRPASRSDNMKNRVKHRGTSQYTGVSKHLYDKWIAHININGKQKHIGLFKNEIDAARAYDKAAIATGNTFYRLNNV